MLCMKLANQASGPQASPTRSVVAQLLMHQLSHRRGCFPLRRHQRLHPNSGDSLHAHFLAATVFWRFHSFSVPSSEAVTSADSTW